MSQFYIAAPFGNYLRTKKARSVIGTFTVEKRTGLIKQIIKTLRYSNGAWYNRIGLRNPGIHFGLNHYYRSKRDIISVAAIEHGDWEKLYQIVPADMDVELNISCPNVTHYKNYVNGIQHFLNGERKVIVKLKPDTTDQMIEHLMHRGFNTFHCCNTLMTERGAMSGVGLRPYVTQMMSTIHFFKSDAEVICGGGIETLADIKYYGDLGAHGFSIGSVCFHPFKLNKLLNSLPEQTDYDLAH